MAVSRQGHHALHAGKAGNSGSLPPYLLYLSTPILPLPTWKPCTLDFWEKPGWKHGAGISGAFHSACTCDFVAGGGRLAHTPPPLFRWREELGGCWTLCTALHLSSLPSLLLLLPLFSYYNICFEQSVTFVDEKLASASDLGDDSCSLDWLDETWKTDRR